MNLDPPDTRAKRQGCLNAIFSLIAIPFRILADLIKSILNPQTRRSTLILIGSVLGSCFLCFGAISIMNATGILNTPTPTFDVNSISTKAILTAVSAYTQTAAALPTFTSTITSTSTITNTPAPTATATPSETPIPTETEFVFATQAPPSNNGANYDSNSDGKVTCKDFTTQAAAQRAYNAGYTNLDGNDNDGKACESLP